MNAAPGYAPVWGLLLIDGWMDVWKHELFKVIIVNVNIDVIVCVNVRTAIAKRLAVS